MLKEDICESNFRHYQSSPYLRISCLFVNYSVLFACPIGACEGLRCRKCIYLLILIVGLLKPTEGFYKDVAQSVGVGVVHVFDFGFQIPLCSHAG